MEQSGDGGGDDGGAWFGVGTGEIIERFICFR